MTDLFQPIKIGSLELKNRLIMLPMDLGLGVRSPRAIAFYRERAEGGAGAIISAGIPVDVFFSDAAWGKEGTSQKFVSGLSELAKTVRLAGAGFGVQLWHGLRLPACAASNRGELVGPSAQGDTRALTQDEVRDVPRRFALAALKAREAGCDFVEIHGAHGYLLSRFFSPHFNRRTDEYGGSLDNRMRLLIECLREIKTKAGREFPVVCRFSASDNDPDGVKLEDAVALAQALAREGSDALDVSFGAGEGDSVPGKDARPATFAPLAEAVKKTVPIAVIAVGKISSPAVAQKVLDSGQGDIIGLGRQLIADPYWPEKVRQGRTKEITFCDYHNTLCMKARHDPSPDKAICSRNQQAGREWQQTGPNVR